MIQSFWSEDTTTLTEEQLDQYKALKLGQKLPVGEIVKNLLTKDRQLVRTVISPEATEDEDGNISYKGIDRLINLLTDFGKNPTIILALNKDGTEYGQNMEYVYNEDGEIIGEELTGTPIYPSNIVEYETFFPEETITEEDGSAYVYKTSYNTACGYKLNK